MILANLILAATVTISLHANEPIKAPAVEASIGTQVQTLSMTNPSGNGVDWSGVCPDWPTQVTATFEDLAGNEATASWTAESAEVHDIPDIRLGTYSLSGPNPVYGGGFPTAEASLDLFDFVELNDTPASSLLFMPIPDALQTTGPPDLTPRLPLQKSVTVSQDPGPPPSATVNVPALTRPPGWWEIGYKALDQRLVGDDIVVEATGRLKYSSFALLGPTVSSGRLPSLGADVPPLSIPWLGYDITIDSLPGRITPPTDVNWTVAINDLDYYRNSRGEPVGIDPRRRDPAAFAAEDGWNISIDPSGVLSISGDDDSDTGPYLLGVLAARATDPNDADTARFLLSKSMLAHAMPTDTPFTYDRSVNLDGLTLGPVPTPENPSFDVRVTIQPGSHWGYHLLGSDSILVPAPLEVVDLRTDPDLPPAADPSLLKYSLAPPLVAAGTGRALKATLHQTASGFPVTGIRLLSRSFTGLEPGEVITFAADIATDITDATHSPDLFMAMASGWGALGMGFNLSSIAVPEIPGVAGTTLGEYQPTIIPYRNEGWRTISVNYTPPLTPCYIDVDGDGDFDVADRNFLATNPDIGSLVREGWDDERTAARASIRIQTRPDMTEPFHVWIDNLRVYRSAYELDLALSKTGYTEPADMAASGLPVGFLPQPAAALDGSFESLGTTGESVADLGAAGWTIGTGDGPAARPLTAPFGWLPSTAVYVSADHRSFSSAQGTDHTRAPGYNRCLRISLTGDDGAPGDYRAVRAWLNSAVVAVPGDGLYCLEAFVSKERSTNRVASDRTPEILFALNEVAPNPLAHNSGTRFAFGGLPDSVWDDSSPWFRVVATAAIPEAQMVRAVVQVSETFTDDVADFSVPIYVDDLRIYRLDDPAEFFDADLFDAL